MRAADHIGFTVWFYNYRLNKKGNKIVPAIKLTQQDCPYICGMNRWSFNKLETYILEHATPELREAITDYSKKIAVIEIVNYSKGWVMPIARN